MWELGFAVSVFFDSRGFRSNAVLESVPELKGLKP